MFESDRAGSGHWLMEERPAETVALIRNLSRLSDAGKLQFVW